MESRPSHGLRRMTDFQDLSFTDDPSLPVSLLLGKGVYSENWRMFCVALLKSAFFSTLVSLGLVSQRYQSTLFQILFVNNLFI